MIILQYYPEICPCTLSHCTVVCHNDNPAVLPWDTSLYIKSLYCGVVIMLIYKLIGVWRVRVINKVKDSSLIGVWRVWVINKVKDSFPPPSHRPTCVHDEECGWSEPWFLRLAGALLPCDNRSNDVTSNIPWTLPPPNTPDCWYSLDKSIWCYQGHIHSHTWQTKLCVFTWWLSLLLKNVVNIKQHVACTL